MSKQTTEDIKAAKDLAVSAAEIVYFYKLIAQSVGRDEDTLALWRKDDPDFSDRLEQGRHRFIQKHMQKARPEFLLERAERELFSPPAQQVEHTGGINPIRILLDAYEITPEGDNEPKADDAIQATSQDQT